MLRYLTHIVQGITSPKTNRSEHAPIRPHPSGHAWQPINATHCFAIKHGVPRIVRYKYLDAHLYADSYAEYKARLRFPLETDLLFCDAEPLPHRPDQV